MGKYNVTNKINKRNSKKEDSKSQNLKPKLERSEMNRKEDGGNGLNDSRVLGSMSESEWKQSVIKKDKKY